MDFMPRSDHRHENASKLGLDRSDLFATLDRAATPERKSPNNTAVSWLRGALLGVAFGAVACSCLPPAKAADAGEHFDGGSNQLQSAAELDGGVGFNVAFVAEVTFRSSASDPFGRTDPHVRVVRFYSNDGVEEFCHDSPPERRAVGPMLTLRIDRGDSDAGFEGTFLTPPGNDYFVYSVARLDAGSSMPIAQSVRTSLEVSNADERGIVGHFESQIVELQSGAQSSLEGSFTAPRCPGLDFWLP